MKGVAGSWMKDNLVAATTSLLNAVSAEDPSVKVESSLSYNMGMNSPIVLLEKAMDAATRFITWGQKWRLVQVKKSPRYVSANKIARTQMEQPYVPK